MNKLKTYPENCTGCMLCVLNCSLKNDGVFNPTFSRLQVRQEIDKDPWGYFPAVCRQCTDPPCAEICLSGALVRKPAGGVTVVAHLCIGCLKCAEVCPAGVCVSHPCRVEPMVCSLCNGMPTCAEACPSGAIVYVDIGEKEE